MTDIDDAKRIRLENVRVFNDRRTRLKRHMEMLGILNSPTDPEGALKAAAQYRLAKDVYMAAETQFASAFAKLSTDELEELLK